MSRDEHFRVLGDNKARMISPMHFRFMDRVDAFNAPGTDWLARPATPIERHHAQPAGYSGDRRSSFSARLLVGADLRVSRRRGACRIPWGTA